MTPVNVIAILGELADTWDVLAGAATSVDRAATLREAADAVRMILSLNDGVPPPPPPLDWDDRAVLIRLSTPYTDRNAAAQKRVLDAGLVGYSHDGTLALTGAGVIALRNDRLASGTGGR